MHVAHTLAFLCLGSIVSCGQSRRLSQHPIAYTRNGSVLGEWNTQSNQDLFLGIPYAQPPIGDLRFRRPRSVNRTWDGLQAISYGAWCLSAPLKLPGFTRYGYDHVEDEDCLTINVVRPHGVGEDARLPVWVSIYGGGFQEGGSADERYGPSGIMEQSVRMETPIIYVSFNYRVSGFGFLAGSELVGSGNANLGLYDQRLALRWIQENIEAFGGNKSRVTIQGESAGALSVGHHILAYNGRDDGLFHAGIAQSGGPMTLSYPVEQHDPAYGRITEQTGCANSSDTVACLRGQPVEVLHALFQDNYYPVVIDNDLVAGPAYDQINLGNFVQCPLLIGTNTNEGTSFAFDGSAGIGLNSREDFLGFIDASTGGLSSDTLNEMADEYLLHITAAEEVEYLSSVEPSYMPYLGSLYGRSTLFAGDMFFISQRRFTTELWNRFGVPVYSYRFDVVPHGSNPVILGAAHFQEMALVFNNVKGLGYDVNPFASPFPSVARGLTALGVEMSTRWITFVNTFSPNLAGRI
jgi:carboxylesterase type B